MPLVLAHRFDAFTHAVVDVICMPAEVVRGVAKANRLIREYERIDHLSDAQLSDQNLQREDLARKVFGPLLKDS